MSFNPIVDLVILAGGKGTRLGLNGIPKPMVEIAGKPLLEHQVALAKANGIRRVFILSNHLASVITDHFGDGEKFGVEIVHLIERSPQGTAGAVRQLAGHLNQRFFLIYGDLYLDMDLQALAHFDSQQESIATLTVHPNDHPYDSDLLEVEQDRVIGLHSKNRPEIANVYLQNLVNAAVYILSPKIFDYIPSKGSSDFGQDIFPKLIQAGEPVRAYRTAEYIKDMGTPERLSEVRRDLELGRPARMTKQIKRPAVFIDRDGVLINYIELLDRAEKLELLPGIAGAVRKLNHSNYLTFVVTNQPVIARNLCSNQELQQIHNKLESCLGKERAFIDRIYFCPHHPDQGYPEENPAYKIDCTCRKPKTGMVDQATIEYNVDLGSSWIIGDSTVDIQTGKNANLKTILVRSGLAGRDAKFEVTPDYVVDDLSAAIDQVFK